MSASSSTTTSFLTPTQRYASGALFALALHQAQINQNRPLGSFFSDDDEPSDERTSSGSSSDSVAGDPGLWVHQHSDLLRPIFRFVFVFLLLLCFRKSLLWSQFLLRLIANYWRFLDWKRSSWFALVFLFLFLIDHRTRNSFCWNSSHCRRTFRCCKNKFVSDLNLFRHFVLIVDGKQMMVWYLCNSLIW